MSFEEPTTGEWVLMIAVFVLLTIGCVLLYTGTIPLDWGTSGTDKPAPTPSQTAAWT